MKDAVLSAIVALAALALWGTLIYGWGELLKDELDEDWRQRIGDRIEMDHHVEQARLSE